MCTGMKRRLSKIVLRSIIFASGNNPRTAGGLSHLLTAGGGGADDRPLDNSKTKEDSDKR